METWTLIFMKGGCEVVGRPKKNGAKRIRISIRLDDEAARELDYLRVKMDLSMTDILRKGLKILYNLEKNRG